MLRRLCSERGFLHMVAVSHRPAIEGIVAERLGRAAPSATDVVSFKAAVADLFRERATAIMWDLHYADAAAFAAVRRRGALMVAVEEGRSGEVAGDRLDRLETPDAVARAVALGADAVNLSVRVSPGASNRTRMHQFALIERVGQQCRSFGVPFVLSPLLYGTPPGQAQAWGGRDLASGLLGALSEERFAVDLFQLESAFAAAGAVIRKPWVLLTAGSDIASFERALSDAFRAGASGFMGGRAFWSDAAPAYPDAAAMADTLGRGRMPAFDRAVQALHASGRPVPSNDRGASGGV